MATPQRGGGFARFLRNLGLLIVAAISIAFYAAQQGWWKPDLRWITERGQPSPAPSPSVIVTPTMDPNTIRIGIDDHPSSLPFYALPGSVRGDLKIVLVPVQDPEVRWQMLAANRLDMAAGSLDSFTVAASRFDAGAVIFQVGRSSGADQLMVSPDVTSVKALAGKRVAVVRGSAGRYLLAEFLNHEAMSPSEVQVVEVDDVRDAVSMLEKGKVKGAWVWTPHGPALANQGYRVLAHSGQRDAMEVIAAASRQAIEKKRPQLEAVIQNWFELISLLHGEPGYGKEVIARGARLKPPVVHEMLEGMTFSTHANNLSIDSGTLLERMRALAHKLGVIIGVPNMEREPGEDAVDLMLLRNVTVKETVPTGSPAPRENEDRP